MLKKKVQHKQVDTSFIIPALNAEKTIANTLSSIVAQSKEMGSFEILVVDNNSTDLTREIAKKYRATILTCRTKGAAATRNYGALKAKGRYLAFIDSDVELSSNWLVTLRSQMEKAMFGIALGPVIPIGENIFLNRFRAKLGKLRFSNTNISLLAQNGNLSPTVNTAACLYRKNMFLGAGGFDERLLRLEDTELSTRLFRQGIHFVADSRAKAYVSYAHGILSYCKRSFELGRGIKDGETLLGNGKTTNCLKLAQSDISFMRTEVFSPSELLFMGFNIGLRLAGSSMPARCATDRRKNIFYPGLEEILCESFEIKIIKKYYRTTRNFRILKIDNKYFILSKCKAHKATIDLDEPKPIVQRILQSLVERNILVITRG